MQANEFTLSITIIMQLPEDAPAETVLEHNENAAALYVVSHMFESLGVLVYHRLLPLHLVDHLIGASRAPVHRRAPRQLRRDIRRDARLQGVEALIVVTSSRRHSLFENRNGYVTLTTPPPLGAGNCTREMMRSAHAPT